MLDDQPPRHAPDFGSGPSTFPGSASAARTDDDAEQMVAAAMPGCLVCWLRDAADRAATARWLAAARHNRHEALAVLCCPLHGWRLWEVSRPDPEPDRRVSAAAGGAHEWHPRVATMLAPAVGALARQLEAVGEHFGTTGWRGRLTHLLGDKPPALLWERPPCPLCASHQQQTAEADERALFSRFAAIYASLPADDRVRVSAQLCPRDRRLCQPYAGTFAELAPVPRRYAAGRLPEWWAPPTAGTEDRGFVTRLIEGDPRLPDDACPACFVRAEHERALLAEIRRMGTRAPSAVVSSLDEAAREGEPGSDVGAAGAAGAAELEAIVEDLCPRHVGLLRVGVGGASDMRGAAPDASPSYIPSRWPAGSLRPVTHESGCMLCMTLWGWNLARMEGMRRAAGSAALYEAITARLTYALAERRYVFCVPHWQQITAPAPREVTLTLLPAQRRGLDHVLGAIRMHADLLQPKPQPRPRDRRAGIHAGGGSGGEGTQTEPCACVAAFAALAGEPG